MKTSPISLVRAAGILAVAGLFLGGWWLWPESRDLSDVEYWKSRIERYGAAQAYETFVDSQKGFSVQDQHVAAHRFGEALYDTQGLNGMSFCGAEFQYGCLHQFFGMALMEGGEEALPKLRSACNVDDEKRGIYCRHAFGHGLVAYYDYTTEGLQKVIDYCDQFGLQDVVGVTVVPSICAMGALMEYGVHTAQGEKATVREPNDGDMGEPCLYLSSDAQAACWYMQPRWWYEYQREKGGKSDQEIVMQSGMWCKEYAPEEYQSLCISGIGKTVAWTVDTERVDQESLCDAVSNQQQDVASCKEHHRLWINYLRLSAFPQM